jgi:predicted hydrocarbon binding protein
MHGIVFSELQKFVETAQGSSGWGTLLEQAQLENRVYLSTSEYPDAEIDALVSAAATLTGRSATVVLEDFGEFIALPLMNAYRHLIPADWKTLDVIGRTEDTIHTVVREENPGAKPPVLHTIRRSVDEVVLIYGSPRKLCALAIGIAKGMARHFNEVIEVTQIKCMHQGAPHCEIVFRTRMRPRKGI